ncbi:hypothetical protein BGX38DRAFT_177065 [Terfezia claveryi]|nr:hypothetical protein BGX38DRAFT_177065 [Terfezia claveryi]
MAGKIEINHKERKPLKMLKYGREILVNSERNLLPICYLINITSPCPSACSIYYSHCVSLICLVYFEPFLAAFSAAGFGTSFFSLAAFLVASGFVAAGFLASLAGAFVSIFFAGMLFGGSIGRIFWGFEWRTRVYGESLDNERGIMKERKRGRMWAYIHLY